jgi:hypothetical protein
MGFHAGLAEDKPRCVELQAWGTTQPCYCDDGVHNVNDASEWHEYKLATPGNTLLTNFSAKLL